MKFVCGDSEDLAEKACKIIQISPIIFSVLLNRDLFRDMFDPFFDIVILSISYGAQN